MLVVLEGPYSSLDWTLGLVSLGQLPVPDEAAALDLADAAALTRQKASRFTAVKVPLLYHPPSQHKFQLSLN